MVNAFDRLLTTLRPHVPGAVDRAVIQELFFVCQHFFKRSEVWQENYEFSLPVGENTVIITPAAGRVERLILVSCQGRPVKAIMPTPGTIIIPGGGHATSPYVVTVVMTVADPTDPDSYPIAPIQLIDRYTEELVHGIASRMMVQPSKPYSNLTLANYYNTKFNSGISRAKNDAKTFYQEGGQNWTYPNSTGGVSVGGGGGGSQVLEGPAGPPGPTGPSVYDVAVQNGFIGTPTEFIESLKGEPGIPGAQGIQGPGGFSAYQIAVSEGFSGSQSEWIASLEGPEGPPGPPGATDYNDLSNKPPLGTASAEDINFFLLADGTNLLNALNAISASLPTSPPALPGKWWNNGGSPAIS